MDLQHHIIWGLVRNAHSQPSSQTYRIRILGWGGEKETIKKNSPGDPCAPISLKSTTTTLCACDELTYLLQGKMIIMAVPIFLISAMCQTLLSKFKYLTLHNLHSNPLRHLYYPGFCR